jgi:hypothetical protein
VLILESQKLALDLTVRLAVGDHAGAAAGWKTASERQQKQAGLYLARSADIVRQLAALETGESVAFRVHDIPVSLCEAARGWAMAYHYSGAAGLCGTAWPHCDCQLDLAMALANLYLRQGEALGFSRGEQAAATARMLAAGDGRDLWQQDARPGPMP